jgi:hypothetical protein
MRQITRVASAFFVHIDTAIHQLAVSSTFLAQLLRATFSLTPSLQVTFVRSTMANPFSTVRVAVNVVNDVGVAQANLTVVSVTVLFPDGSTSTYDLTNAVENDGQGNYHVTYTTKDVGMHKETWIFTNIDGSVAEYRNVTPVSY